MWAQINRLLEQSANRILSGIANFLPGVLAFIVVFLITILVAFIIRVALRRFLRRVDFDEVVHRWGFPEVAEWSPQRSPSVMASQIVSWCIILIGLLVGIYALDASLDVNARRATLRLHSARPRCGRHPRCRNIRRSFPGPQRIDRRREF